MRWILSGLALIAACGSTTPLPPVIESRAADPVAPTLENEIARSLELDYRSPMQPREKSQVEPLLTAKCKDGDRGACLRASMFRFGMELQPEIEANCTAGDELSCRAIASVKVGFRDQYPYKLSSAELRRGCAAGLWAECDLLMESGVRADVRFGAEVSCIATRFACTTAGSSYMNDEPRNLDRARYLHELGCQADVRDCLSLAFAYVEKLLPEPMEGRGIDLVREICRRGPDDGGRCKAGKVPWALTDDKPVFTP
jgi:hypothetical protein